MTRSEGHFRGHDGIELYFQLWQHPNPKGTLLLTHGLGEHSDRYHHVAESLQKAGWQTLAWELRGHGRSDGKRGYVSSFDDFVLDHQTFTDMAMEHIIKGKHPFAYFGHSMGGMVTLLSLMRFGARGAGGLVLSSPLVDVAVEVPVVKDRAAHVLARVLPRVTLHNEIQIEDLTRDPEMIRSLEHDPLRHEKISAELYLGIRRSKEELFHSADHITLPLLMQLAERDRIVSTPAAQSLFEVLKSEKKNMIVYKDNYHEIYNDVDREQVLNDLKGFLNEVV